MKVQFFHNLRHPGAALVLALALIFVLPGMAAAGSAAPRAAGGVMDLSSRDFAAQGSLALNGEWRVFRGQLLDPAAAVAGTGTATEVPDIWGPNMALTPAGGYGKATYKLRVHVPPGSDQLALRSFRMRSIVEIYAHVPGPDGGAGRTYLLVRPTDSRRQEDLHAGPIYLPFTAETFDLVFLLENRSHKQGGITEAPILGLRGAVEAAAGRDRSRVTGFVVLLGGASMVGLVLGLALRGGRRFILFAIVGTIGAARIVTTSQLFGDYFPELPLSRKYDFEYLVLFLSLPAIYGFIASLFPKDNFRIFHKALNILAALLAAFALFVAPGMLPGTVTLLREPFQVMLVVTLVMAVSVCVRALVNQRRGAKFALWCLLILVISAFVEMSYYIGLAPYAINAGHVGITLVFLLFMIGAVQRFRQLQVERETQNVQLQDLNASLKTRSSELEIANRKANAASQAKSDFLAVLSHEIRTPLTGMIGMTGVLEKEVSNREHSRLMAAARRSGEGLLGLLNDMLDLSKVEAGATRLNKTPFTLSLLVDQINDLWLSPMKEKHLAFSVSCSYPADRALIGDVGRIRQILHNLIGNARKFTDRGSVKVEFAGQDMGKDRMQLEISVTDTGIGVPTGQQDQIFSLFTQADSSRSRQYGGTGLGLSICKQFTELMGGSIKLKSEPGKGSTFSLVIPCEIHELPVAEDAATAANADRDRAREKPARSLHILVAEDVPLNQEVVRRMLGSLGHDVTIVEDGQEAVNTCREIAYDMVLMDLQMPGLDGISATRMIRSLAAPMGDVPIFALTADVGSDVRREIEAAGMAGMVSKPIEPAQLRRVVDEVVAGLVRAGTVEAEKQNVKAT